jgi:hypothetical protein
MKTFPLLIALVCAAAPALADDPAPSPEEILAHVLDSDPFGLSGGAIVAHATLTDRNGSTSALSFSARSKRLSPGLSESMVRFSSPPELAGAAFLQVQKKEADDDRYLYLPDLKRSRRISGSLRGTAFMGTDLTFEDLDRRDFREAKVTMMGSEAVDKWDCYVVDAVPTGPDSQYSHSEVWVRKDNYVPLKMKFYDRSKNLIKTFTALEVRRVSGQWFISKSRTTTVPSSHSTDVALDHINPAADLRSDEFTVRALEKSQ